MRMRVSIHPYISSALVSAFNDSTLILLINVLTHSHSQWWVNYGLVLMFYSHGVSRISGFRCFCHRLRPQFYHLCDRRCLGNDYRRHRFSAYYCGRVLCTSSESVFTGNCGDIRHYYGHSMLSLLWKSPHYYAHQRQRRILSSEK
jgi:hypothetical protein